MKTHALFLAVILFSASAVAIGQDQDALDARPRTDFRGHSAAVTRLAFSHDGKFLLSAGRDSRMGLWSLETGRLVHMLYPKEKNVSGRSMSRDIPRRVESIAFSPDGGLIAEAAVESAGEGLVRLWSPKTGKIIKVLARGVDNLRAVAFAPDGKTAAYNARETIGWRHKIVLCDVESGKVTGELAGKKLAATMLAFSPDGKILASAGARKIQLWDVEKRELLHTIEAHEKSIQGIAFSPNGKLLASGADDDQIRIWRVDAGKMDLEIEAEQDGVLDVAFTPSGATVASGGKNHTVKLWKTTSGKKYARLWGHLERVNCIAVSPDGKTLASGSGDTTIALWNLTEPEDADEDEDDEDEWADDD